MKDNFFETSTPTYEDESYKALTAVNDVSKYEGYVAAAKTGFTKNLFSMGIDVMGSHDANALNPLDMLSAEEANETYNPEVPFTENIHSYDAELRKNREMYLKEQAAITRQSNLGGFGQFMGNLNGGFADPITIGASMLTAGTGGLIAKSFINTGTFVKTAKVIQGLGGKYKYAVDIAKELGESLVVAAALEIPVAESLENVYGTEFTAKEHAFNIATGTALGTVTRYIGRAFATPKSKPDAVDIETTKSEIIHELKQATIEDRAPNFDAAMQRRRADISAKALSEANIKRANAVIENHDNNGNIFLSSHTPGATDVVGSQIKYGTALGDGIYMVSNPVLAESKSVASANVDVIKYDVSNMKLLDLEQNVTPELRKVIEDNLKDILPREPDVKKALRKLSTHSTIKEFMSVLEELEDLYQGEYGNTKVDIQGKFNKLMADQDYDGYRYKEEFFEGKEVVGEGVFILKESDALKNSVQGRYEFNAENRAKSPEPVEAEVETVKGESEQTVFIDDDPSATAKDWEDKVREVFDPAKRDAPETQPAELLAEVDDAIEVANDISGMVEDLVEGRADPFEAERMEVKTQQINALDKPIKFKKEFAGEYSVEVAGEMIEISKVQTGESKRWEWQISSRKLDELEDMFDNSLDLRPLDLEGLVDPLPTLKTAKATVNSILKSRADQMKADIEAGTLDAPIVRDNPDSAHSAKLKEIVEKGTKEMTEAETLTKAAIVCGKRNG